jgi:NAD(P)-dependent dehydrogenase (short-subunit alcohol dehydrogenase family)
LSSFKRNKVAILTGASGIVDVQGDIADPGTARLVECARAEAPAAPATLMKARLAAVTRSLAIEYAARRLGANAVSLGVIKTPIYDESCYASIHALHPLGCAGEIEDVVWGVLYLESAPS